MANSDSLIELNVSGVHYTASKKTLTSQPNSLIAKWFTPGSTESAALLKDSKVRRQIDILGAASSLFFYFILLCLLIFFFFTFTLLILFLFPSFPLHHSPSVMTACRLLVVIYFLYSSSYSSLS